MSRSVKKQLMLFALAAGLGLAAVHQLTKEAAETNRENWSRRLVLEAAGLNPEEWTQGGDLQLLQSGHDWQLLRGARVTALVLYHAGEPGYNGRIPLWVGLAPDGRILGVRVISHRETPGLGDRIETDVSPWIHQFRGRSLGNPGISGWALKQHGGDFDGFSGATITPRAVVAGIGKVLQKHERLNAEP